METKDPIFPYYRDSRGIRHPLKKRKPLKRTPLKRTALKRKKPLKKKAVKPKEKKQYYTISYKQLHPTQTRAENQRNDWTLYDKVWKEGEQYDADGNKIHKCAECGCFLPSPPKSYNFSHILSKGGHTVLRLIKDNIEILCLDHHQDVDFGNKEAMKIYDPEKIRWLRMLEKYIMDDKINRHNVPNYPESLEEFIDKQK